MKHEQGSVTIMLCILFLVFIMLAGVLIDSARFVVAEAQVKRAARTAINSVLSEYDVILKDRYGLFGINASDTADINKKITKYMQRSLNPSHNLRQGSIFTYFNEGGSLTGLGEYLSTLNTYESTTDDNFITDEKSEFMPDFWSFWKYELPDKIYTNQDAVYPLTNTSIFKQQVLEYMKYRAPLQAIEGFVKKLGVVMRSNESAKLVNERTEVEKKLDAMNKALSEMLKLTDGWYFDEDSGFKTLKDSEYFVKKLNINDKYYADSRLNTEQLKKIVKLLEKKTLDDYEILVYTIKHYYDSYLTIVMLSLFEKYFVNELNMFLPELKDMAYQKIDSEILDLENQINSLKNQIESLKNTGDGSEPDRDEIDRLEKDIGDLKDDISDLRGKKNDIKKSGAKDFAINYSDYISVDNKGTVDITDDEIDHCSIIAGYCRKINKELTDYDNSISAVYNSIKSNIETITENIGNYNKVCSKAKDQFETFEKAREAAQQELDNYKSLLDEKKDNLLPGDYEAAINFINETQQIIGTKVDDALANTEEVLELLQNNIKITEEVKNLPDAKDIKKAGEKLYDMKESAALSGDFEEIEKLFKNFSYVLLGELEQYKSNVVPYTEVKNKADSCRNIYLQWENGYERFENGYRIDICYNDKYKEYSVAEIKSRQSDNTENTKTNESPKSEMEKEISEKQTSNETALKGKTEGKTAAELTKNELESLPSVSANVKAASKNDNKIDAKKGLNMLDGSFNILGAIENALVNIRDELYYNEYVINHFKTAVDVNNESTRTDLRNRLIKDLKTRLNYEVEYILYGSKNDQTNFIICTSAIFAIRTVMNLIHIYTDPEKCQITLALAAAAAGWWTAGLGVPIFQAIISALWAMAESAIDVAKLVDGEEVAFFKSKQDWFTWKEGVIKQATKLIEEQTTELVSAGIQKLCGAVKEWANERTEEVEKFIKDKMKDFSDKTKDVVRDALNTYVDEMNKQIDMALQEFDTGIRATVKNCFDFARINKSLDFDISKVADSDLMQISLGGISGKDITDTVINYVKGYISSKGIDFESLISYENMENCITDLMNKLKNTKTSYLNALKQRADDELENMFKKMEEKVNEVSDKAKAGLEDISEDLKEKLEESATNMIKEQIANFTESEKIKGMTSFLEKTGSSRDISEKRSFTSMFYFSYLDYLRLFLILANEKDKILRTQDLIHLNMRLEKENAGFSLATQQTAIKLNSETSINIIFLNLPFMPEVAKKFGEGEDHGKYKLSFSAQGSY